ncbi:MAG TPA: serine/threonine-protein kinase, partial [Gemmataceae bacterium]|nr:serine/threonine-protein kinase [Gemmataceae bacterium]
MERRPPPPVAESELATNPLSPAELPSSDPPATNIADVTPINTNTPYPGPELDPPSTNVAQVTPIHPEPGPPSLVSELGSQSVEDFFPRSNEEFLHFRVVEELGRGAFARVYLARQEALANRLVAIKVTTVPTLEPQRLARLQHSNVVPVYSVHEAGKVQVVCMPFLGRTTLADVIRSLATGDGPRHDSGRALATALAGHKPGAAPPPAGELGDENRAALAGMSFVEGCLSLVAQIAGGLAHAHARGILHRDLKPANVLVTDEGVPMILDFNVSVESGPEAASKRVGGTIPYMAPEQLRAYAGGSDPVDERSDLYSLGVVLYELLTGRLPYPSGPISHATLPAVIERRGAPPPPVGAIVPGVTPAVESILGKLLDPVAEKRYARADDLREDLRRQLAHQPLAFAPDRSVRERLTKWRRRNPRGATGLAVAFAAFLFLILPVTLLSVRQARIEARARQLQAVEAVVEFNKAMGDLRVAAVRLGSRADPS